MLCAESGTDSEFLRQKNSEETPWPSPSLAAVGLRCLDLIGMIWLVDCAPLDFSRREWDKNNGGGGDLPLLATEFHEIGLQNKLILSFCIHWWKGIQIAEIHLHLALLTFWKLGFVSKVHDECVPDIILPGTAKHVGEKLIHMAAVNCTHGGHHNTNPRCFIKIFIYCAAKGWHGVVPVPILHEWTKEMVVSSVYL